MNGDYRNTKAHLRLSAYRVYVVPDDSHNAGGIDKGSLWAIAGHQFMQCVFKFPGTAEYHILFPQVRAKTQAMQLRSRAEGSPDIPGVGSAANRPVDKVQGVGYGIENNPGAAEDAGTLTYCAGGGRGFTAQGVTVLPDGKYLTFPFPQQGVSLQTPDCTHISLLLVLVT
jgi:hypothetical protein